MTAKIVQKNNGLLQAFRKYKERYLSVGKKPDISKFLPGVLYRTMRLEGEQISRKEARALFK